MDIEKLPMDCHKCNPSEAGYHARRSILEGLKGARYTCLRCGRVNLVRKQGISGRLEDFFMAVARGFGGGGTGNGGG